MRVAITRALPDAERTAARLSALGVTPVLAPLLSIVPCGYDTNTEGAQALIFTSSNGVRAFPDVRGAHEYQEEHIAGSYHMMMGDVPARLGELPLDQLFALQCGSGVRSQLVWSVLERAGFTNMMNLTGGLDEYKKIFYDILLA